MTVKSPSERDGEDGALVNLDVLSEDVSEDEGEKGENGTHAAVLLRFGVLFVVGLENPLLKLLLQVLAGLDSFEFAVEGGEGRYLTPVVEDGVDDIISFPCLVLKGEGDDDDIIVEPEADNGRGLFICCLSFFCFRFVISSVTELCRFVVQLGTK